ncbi:hypothetical protein D9M71_361160 [compost metagenome]
MFVGGEGVQAEAAVGRRVDGQCVVMAEQDRLAVAHYQQLGREGPVEGPQGVMVLHRHVGVEAHLDTTGGAVGGGQAGGVVVEPAGAELTLHIAVALVVVTNAAVGASTGLHGLDVLLRVKLIPTLV